jgi:uncharacterized damage-inducible protein DinB
MAIVQSLLPEFDHEMKTTRSLIALVPDADPSWKPHAKSTSIGTLALHIAELAGYAVATMRQTELDLTPGRDGRAAREFVSAAENTAVFDRNVAEARAAIAAGSDDDLMVPWSLKGGGRTVFTMPRIVVLRTFIFNHMIHHRGQLSVYLRLRDVPLPSIYGPTADSPM